MRSMLRNWATYDGRPAFCLTMSSQVALAKTSQCQAHCLLARVTLPGAYTEHKLLWIDSLSTTHRKTQAKHRTCHRPTALVEATDATQACPSPLLPPPSSFVPSRSSFPGTMNSSPPPPSFTVPPLTSAGKLPVSPDGSPGESTSSDYVGVKSKGNDKGKGKGKGRQEAVIAMDVDVDEDADQVRISMYVRLFQGES